MLRTFTLAKDSGQEYIVMSFNSKNEFSPLVSIARPEWNSERSSNKYFRNITTPDQLRSLLYEENLIFLDVPHSNDEFLIEYDPETKLALYQQSKGAVTCIIENLSQKEISSFISLVKFV